MNSITEGLLKIVSDFKGAFKGAFSIREDGKCVERRSTENIKITSKTDVSGLEVHVKPNTKGETVYIPACVTQDNITDIAYNDFYIGEDADIEVVAGCGVHSGDEGEAAHNGIHRFYLEKGAHVVYREKHIGTGGNAKKSINPVTEVYLGEDASLEMDTVQLGGVSYALRKTSGTVGARARLVVRERLMTDDNDFARTEFSVSLDGEDCGVNLMSRSVARGNSHQEFYSVIKGNNRCSGHSECDAILSGNGTVTAEPALEASHVDASLIHEAAIGKIAGEQILKLQTLGLTEKEAEEKIVEGFLR